MASSAVSDTGIATMPALTSPACNVRIVPPIAADAAEQRPNPAIISFVTSLLIFVIFRPLKFKFAIFFRNYKEPFIRYAVSKETREEVLIISTRKETQARVQSIPYILSRLMAGLYIYMVDVSEEALKVFLEVSSFYLS